MKISSVLSTVVAGALLLAAGSAMAQNNQPPPAGAILDLNGQPIANDQQQYTVNFMASVADTAITFAFRQDPAFLSFSGVSVVDTTTSSGNLLTNGDFSGGVYTDSGNTDVPIGWTYANIYGAADGGQIDGGCGVGGSNCWYDGAVQAYDAISQTIATNIGDTYQISFFLNGGYNSTPNYSRLATNGGGGTSGNGVDVLAYAQAGLPVAGTVPEPAAWGLMILGFGGVGYSLRRRRTQVANAATA